MPASTPAADGFSMPAEWAPHERTLVAWPAREPLWGPLQAEARAAYAATVRAIARFEPVTVVANPGARVEAEAVCANGSAAVGFDIEVVEEPLDDSWVRDTGPIGLLDRAGRRRAVDFGFNGWGAKFEPFGTDAALGERLCARLGLQRYGAPFVLEGGAIAVDGAGTLVTTEQCLLHPNRNPSMTRADIERGLRDWLGVERIVWLERGLVEDRDTDGHVDNVFAFVTPGAGLLQGTADPAHPDAELLTDARHRLEGAGIAVTVVDVLPTAVVAGRSVVVPPLNFYQCNGGGVIVPVAEADEGATDAALACVTAALPNREVVGVPGSVLAFGGGGVHCITQQVPRAATGATSA